MALAALRRQVEKVRESVAARADSLDCQQYRFDPVAYGREVLGIDPWAKQIEIAESTLKPPYRTLAPSGHSCGKTFTQAWLANWWYDTRDPGCVLTTAPTHRDVCDLLWTEIRLQRQAAGLGGFIGPAAPEMRTSPDHFAKGYTAEYGESFQGRHRPNMLFLFDEATRIPAIFWTTLRTMFAPTGDHAVVCSFNPTDTGTAAYEEFLEAGAGYPERGWHVIQMSSLDHPNIERELRGQPPKYPSAVRLAQVDDWVETWCTRIDPGDVQATDFAWRPESGQWWRPGPLFECRCLGLWPSQSTYAVWSNAVWMLAEHGLALPARDSIPQIGCDPARFGDDFTSIHVRDDTVSLHHETHNGWSTAQTAGWLKRLAGDYAVYAKRKTPDLHIRPEQIPIKVDCGGGDVGSGVMDQAGEYNFIAVDTSQPARGANYKNARSELWFHTAAGARAGRVNLAKLPQPMLALLRQQAMAPVWKVNAGGQAEVEPKQKTKERLGRSPDDMDGMNLAYYDVGGSPFIGIDRDRRPQDARDWGQPSRFGRDDGRTAAQRRGLYGT
jgi:hypothetical protein